MNSKVTACSDTVISADIRRCSHSEEQQFHLWIISLTSAADVLTSLCLNFLPYKTVSNDTDGCHFWTVQNTLSIVHSKSVFLDHSITEVPAHPKTPGVKPFWFQWELFMLDEMRMMHKSLFSVGTDSDSASAQISPEEEITSILAKYFNIDENVLGLALSGNHFTTGTINRVHSYKHSPMLKVS